LIGMAREPQADFAEVDRWLDRLLDAPAAERTQILAGCADTTLRDRLCTLLAADSRSGPLDETPQTLARTVLHSGDPRSAEARHGARMGAYRIVSLLGEGGSATVWLGTRDDGAITHEVAVKCLKSGLATPEQRARFVREQQILARLAHPTSRGCSTSASTPMAWRTSSWNASTASRSRAGATRARSGCANDSSCSATCCTPWPMRTRT